VLSLGSMIDMPYEAVRSLAVELFLSLERETSDPPGITREAFGKREQFAHDLASETARSLGLEVSHDVAGNQYMTWLGRDRAKPRTFVGSHMDTVRHGGNFDGAAGVIMGLCAIHGLKDVGFTPDADLVVMAIRAEELVWFPTPYAGSRMAFGLLPSSEYDEIRRSDTDRSLASHMLEAGFDPDALKAGARPLDPKTIGLYIEPHIEQGPVLIESGQPVGIVTGLRGNMRYPHCRVHGAYSHAGAVPREYRKDAVFAAVEFASALEALWDRHERSGTDFVATIGQLQTDPVHHGMTKISGEVRFTMDFRSLDEAVLMEADRQLRDDAQRISRARCVTIELGEFRKAEPALMNDQLIKELQGAAADIGVDARLMPSGAGHDCATFAWQGVPSAMIFIRNDKGSHNPDEAMELDDFWAATETLVAFLKRVA
jgi:N-carbamoyl-L-amino-acid hydrolase